MNVTYKIRVNRPCKLFIDQEETQILDELDLVKIQLPKGEYLRKVISIDDSSIFDEAIIVLDGSSKIDIITLDTKGLDAAKANALPNTKFKIGNMYYQASIDKKSVVLVDPEHPFRYSGDISIPENINYAGYTYKVTHICHKAFYNAYSLNSVSISNTIESIEDMVFEGCNSLTAISFGTGLRSIGPRAFRGCSLLKSISLPQSVNDIEEEAFAYCGLDSIIIPQGVMYIGKRAFMGCHSLQIVSISHTVTTVKNGAFRDCSSLSSIIIESDNSHYDCRNSCNAIIKTDTNTLIAGCKNTKIPKDVRHIQEEAFWGIKDLTCINLPESLISIGAYAFSCCESLKSIIIPNLVEEIGEHAFSMCSALESIIVKENNSIYDSRENSNAIIETKSNTLIVGCKNSIIPCSVIKIGKAAFCGSKQLLNIKIHNNITHIEDSAFGWCDAMKSIYLPNTIKKIGMHAFYRCNSETLNVYYGDTIENWNLIVKGYLWEQKSITRIHCIDGEI